jgi:spore germination protein YaaH
MIDATWGKRRATLLVLFFVTRGSHAAAQDARHQVTTWAIIAPWDARSTASANANAERLDGIVSGWIQLDSLTGLPSRAYPDAGTRAPNAPQRLALVTSWQGQRFHPEMVRRLAADRNALALTASRIGAIVASEGYRGVVLDIEGQSRADLPLTLRVVGAIRDSAKAHGATMLAVALPAADTSAYPTRDFLPLVDYVMVMLIDEHRSTSGPGPVASPEWVRRTLAQRVAEVGAKRVIAALPLYGYLWRRNRPALTLSFDDARRASAQSGVELRRDPASQSLHAQAADGERWMSDAHLLRVRRHEVMDLGVDRIALWWLGLEDPAVWSVFVR